jgi:hypothetical protein
MKNVAGVLSLTTATAAIGWTFGSGSLEPVGGLILVLSWAGCTWSCMQD